MLTEKERRILAYHEAGHALMSHLMGEIAPVQKVTIVSRGTALGYTLNLPAEDRYLETKEELIDMLKIALAGRAAEQVVFGRVTNGAANDLEKATEIARAMVFEWGMSEVVTSRTMRADNYALSEETKRLRDNEQARLTDEAYAEAVRLIEKHRASLDRLTQRAAREGDAQSRGGAAAARGRRAGVARVRDRRHAAWSSPLPGDELDARIASPLVRARGIHHLGVAVEDLETALDNVRAALRRRGRASRRRWRSRACGRRRCASATSRVELLEPLGEDTPVGRFLAKRGPGMHHVAYEVERSRRRPSPSSPARAQT